MAETMQRPIFDSLPYYDNDLEAFPALRSKVDQELARELKHISQQSLHPSVPPPVTLFDVSTVYDRMVLNI